MGGQRIMTMTINGTYPRTITHNGTGVGTVTHNGEVVWPNYPERAGGEMIVRMSIGTSTPWTLRVESSRHDKLTRDGLSVSLTGMYAPRITSSSIVSSTTSSTGCTTYTCRLQANVTASTFSSITETGDNLSGSVSIPFSGNFAGVAISSYSGVKAEVTSVPEYLTINYISTSNVSIGLSDYIYARFYNVSSEYDFFNNGAQIGWESTGSSISDFTINYGF